MTVRVAGPEKQVQKALKEIYGTKYVETLGSKEEDSFDFIIETEKDVDIRKPMFNTLSKLGYPILMLRSMDLTLEDIFLQLTTEEKEVI